MKRNNVKKMNSIRTKNISVNRSFGYFLFLIAVLFSCNKFVEIGPPSTQIVSEQVYSNDATASGVIRGIYSQMISSSGFASGGLSSVTVLSGLSADEFINYSTNINNIQFYKNALLPTNSNLLGPMWQECYRYINNANTVIEGVNGSTNISGPVKSELLGEAKFVRAFCHYYLTSLFGNVPYITSTNYLDNFHAARDKQSDVFAKIINDLQSAQSLLLNDFSFSNNERDQPNRGAATALLSRVYLSIGDWKDAEQETSLIISNISTYNLVTNLDSVFLANSTEAIWQLQPTSTTINTFEGNLFILNSAPLNVSLSSKLLSAFEFGDLRRKFWIDSLQIGVQLYYYPFKYQLKTGPPGVEYSMVLRLAEQYLIRAEARAQQSNTTGAVADLNAIRLRAGLSAYSGSTAQAPLLSAILHERQVELFTEWGHRWIDLRRTGSVDSIMNIATPIKGGVWDSHSQLYPIPQSERNNDDSLTQNAGY